MKHFNSLIIEIISQLFSSKKWGGGERSRLEEMGRLGRQRDGEVGQANRDGSKR